MNVGVIEDFLLFSDFFGKFFFPIFRVYSSLALALKSFFGLILNLSRAIYARQRESLLTLVAENFFSEIRAGASDMPMQLQFDFRFSRAMKEHLKQMCSTRFSYYTSATSHYPRVKSDLIYSALPKMSSPFTAQ